MSEVRDQLTEWTVCRETTTNKNMSIADNNQIGILKTALSRKFPQKNTDSDSAYLAETMPEGHEV